MNVTSLEEMRQAQAARAAAGHEEPVAPVEAKPPQAAVDEKRGADDHKMELIRELLLGDHLEVSATRLTQLEKRQEQFEADVLRRLDLLSQRLDALSRDVLADRRTAFDELARAMHELGSRVRGI